MIRKFIYFFLFIFVFGLISAQNKENISFLSYSVETSGGLMLATDIYLSDHNSIFPTILIRTPYNKANWKNTALQLTQLGYAVVVQDCRGKFESEGEFYAFKNEREDGIETIKWIKKQPWYNGKIAGYGSSYLGFTQWAVSDHLDAVCADFTGANIYDLIYPQGLFSLETSFNWGLANDSKTINSISPENIQKSYWHLPLSEADDVAYKDNRFINDWILYEKNDNYWHSVNHRGIAKGPVFSIAGWYDIFLIGQLNDFIAVDKKNAYLDNKIIITPWCHGTQSLENDYGGENKTGNTGALLQQFLAKTMLGKGEVKMDAPFTNNKYNFFIMERNEYFGSETWPPKEVKNVDYFLEKNLISLKEPDKADKLSFVYNPEDPYPSIGGTSIGTDVGPATQNENNNRKDQWVFETDVLETPLTLLGSVSASLYVSSSVRNTEFIVLVQDVFPNDTIVNIQEGGIQVDLVPNEIVKIKLDSWPTGYQLNPGHKLRVVVTSSWFPRFNRNLNNNEAIFRAKENKKALQSIYLGPSYPSTITLPVLNIGS